MIKRHLIAWLIGTVIILILNLWFGDRMVIEQFKQERTLIEQTMGDGAADRIRNGTNFVYRYCCNWVADFTYKVFVPPTKDEYGVQQSVASSHQAFWTSIYMIITRLFVLAEWLVVFWVLVFAAGNHGLTKRAISVTNTAWSSPVRYHLGLHYLVGVIGLVINYVLWPWSVHPYIAAFLLGLTCLVVYVITSNIQPKV